MTENPTPYNYNHIYNYDHNPSQNELPTNYLLLCHWGGGEGWITISMIEQQQRNKATTQQSIKASKLPVLKEKQNSR